MLVGELNTNSFMDILDTLNRGFELSGKLNLQSQNVHAEDFYKRVLNGLYGWNLVNANEANQNSDAIDLIDDVEKLVVQVTVTCTTTKVNDTLKKEATRGYKEKGYRLKFAFVGKQESSIRTRGFKNEHGIAFDPKGDILFTEDLVRRFSHRDPAKQEELLHAARQETGQAFMLTKELVERRFDEAKRMLGSKYTPELCVRVRQMRHFEALIHPDAMCSELSWLAERCLAAVRPLVQAFDDANPIFHAQPGGRPSLPDVLARFSADDARACAEACVEVAEWLDGAIVSLEE